MVLLWAAQRELAVAEVAMPVLKGLKLLVWFV
jgi:hypothetical protein